jgi:uncharacterized damage-inducible protein DinB
MENQRSSFLLEPPERPLSSSMALLRQAKFSLRESNLVKIEGALRSLSDEQIWWRPNESCNSIGNLLLHLAGNLRQWVIAGVGGAEDLRDRQREFTERKQISKVDLLGLLKNTIDEVEAVIANIENELSIAKSDEPLQRECLPQGFSQTVFDVLFHVVEHFSYHTGQIIFIAKTLESGQLKFYDDRLLSGRNA